MKKLLVISLLGCLLFAGCEKTNNTYKEGVYEGSAVDTYGGAENTATAKVTIDKNGKITAVYVDTTYTKDGVATTKKALKEDYGMKLGNGAGYGSSEWEWYEQAENLEKAVVENQGIDFLKLDEDGYTDTVSGCTIRIDALTNAIRDALNKAK